MTSSRDSSSPTKMDALPGTERKSAVDFLLDHKTAALAAFIVFLGILVTLRAPDFASISNLFNIVDDMAILAIVSVGQMLVMVTGGIDISVGTGLGLVGMSVGLIIINTPLNPVIALALGAIMGIALGFLNALLVVKGRIVALIVTLGTMNIFRGLNVFINSAFYNGQYIGANKLSSSFIGMTDERILGLPILHIYVAVIYAGFYYLLAHTRTGRHIYATGSNNAAAEIAGIRTSRIIMTCYILCGMLAGIGGVLWVSRYQTAQSDTGLGFEFLTITAVIIGGVSVYGGSGSIWGVLLGSLLVGMITNALNVMRLSPFWKLALNGLILLLAVLLNRYVERTQKERNLRLRRG
jgi:rhamnose transport system permease protein